MALSVYETILETMAQQIGALSLQFENALIPVNVRKLPKKEEALDTCPLIVVAPDDRAEDIAPFSTENEALVKYRLNVVLIAAGDGDYTAADLDTWLRFREQIRRLFQWIVKNVNLPNNADLFKGDVLPEAPLDHGQLNQLYNYSGLGFRFWVVEKTYDGVP